jgi:microcystin-dependent protein
MKVTGLLILIVTDPPGGQSKSLGDDSIREIKRAIANAFPNSPVNDAYTGTLAELNDLVGGNVLPRNTVVMWNREAGDPVAPTGWTVCDGSLRDGGTGDPAPDLRGRFIMGAKAGDAGGTFPAVGDTGGSSEVDIRNPDNTLVKFTTDGTAISKAQTPPHDHKLFTASTKSQGVPSTPPAGSSAVAWKNDSGGGGGYANVADTAIPASGKTSDGTGLNGDPHTHTFSIDGSQTFTGANNPLWYGLIYIIKD